MWLNEDEEIFEAVYQELEDYYYTVDSEVMFYDVKDEMTQLVRNKLGMDEIDAYEFVCKWFDNRH